MVVVDLVIIKNVYTEDKLIKIFDGLLVNKRCNNNKVEIIKIKTKIYNNLTNS